jgi:hypothetical protein
LDQEVWDDLGYFQKEDWVMGWVKKLSRPLGGAAAADAAVDPEWLQELPALHEYLVSRVGADGNPRRTCTVTLFAEDGSWKVFCNERQHGCSLCASGSSVAAALSALEVLLESEDAPWRWSEANGKPQGRPKGKGH